MGKKNIHTVPFGDRWAVKKEGVEAAISTHKTKSIAQDKGTSLAKKDGVEHVIHGRDGRIQDKDSYGKDPCPPKDKKH
jgi:hypothetical protein